MTPILQAMLVHKYRWCDVDASNGGKNAYDDDDDDDAHRGYGDANACGGVDHALVDIGSGDWPYDGGDDAWL